MDKYDKAEKKAKWLASPEYAQQQEDQRIAAEKAEREKREEDLKSEEQKAMQTDENNMELEK